MNFNNSRNTVTAFLALCFVGLLVMGCVATSGVQQTQAQGANVTNSVVLNMTNPASVYCVQNGGVSAILTAADGSQSGACTFPDGSQCDEWAYYRGTCTPKSRNTATTAAVNASGLDSSDFVVMEDAMPNLLSSGEPVNVPE